MRTGLMSSRNSPTLTLDVRMRRAERCAAWLVLGGGACSALLLGTQSADRPAGWRRLPCRHRLRPVAGRLDRVQAPDRRTCAGWRTAAGCWSMAVKTHSPAELAGGTRLFANALWLQWRTPRIAASVRCCWRPATCRRVSCGRWPCACGSRLLSGHCPKPGAMRTVRERRHEAAKMCRSSANFPRGDQSIGAVLGGRSASRFRPAFRPREDAGR